MKPKAMPIFPNIPLILLQSCLFSLGKSEEFKVNSVWGSSKNTAALRLTKDLKANYDASLRPKLNFSEPLEVTHFYILKQIVYLDSKEQRLKALLFDIMTWRDEYLTWDPEDYEGLDSITLLRTDVWLPDVVVFNQLGESNSNYYMKESLIPINLNYTCSERAMERFRGEIRCETPLMLESICVLDIRHFPFDRQTCELSVGSWSQTNETIQMSLNLKGAPEGIDLNQYDENSEWALEGVAGRSNEIQYSGNEEFFSELHYEIRLCRRTQFYSRNLILPTILTSQMSILVFLLPPESGEKVSLAITVFLALSLNMLVISDHIPANSLQIPIASKYTLYSMAIVSVSLWLSVLVINIHSIGNYGNPFVRKPNKKLMKICQWAAPILCLSDRPKEESSKVKLTLDDSFLQMETSVDGNNCHQQNNGVVFNNANASPSVLKTSSKSAGSDSTSCANSPIINPETLQELEKALAKLSNKVMTFLHEASEEARKQSLQEEITHDWKFIARCVDRFFAYFYLIVNVIAVGFFFPYYF